MRRVFITALAAAGIAGAALPAIAAGNAAQPAPQSVAPSDKSSSGGCHQEYPAQSAKPSA
ncbi:MAG: hypothetical protein RIM80_17615 [Alphaproteobacteria bacterium]